MKQNVTSWATRAAVLAGLIVGGTPALALTAAPQPPPVASVSGQVESVDASSRALKIKAEDGAAFVITLSEKGTVVKIAPGALSLQNAAPIEIDSIQIGDRVLVRGGVRTDGRIDGALRVAVMAQTDLAARNEQDARAWRERGIAGTVTAVDPTKGEFTIRTSGAAPAARAQGLAPAAAPTTTPTLTVDATKAVLHRYADTSVKFADAKPAAVADVAVGDQARLLGKRSEDGSRITAERVVFGSFKTMALAIEKVDAATGSLNVKDLETNRKFTISVVAGGTIKKIPAEMAAMFAMMNGGGGRPGGAAQRPEGRGAPGASMGGRPEGGHAGGQAGGPGMGEGGRGSRGMEDMMDRLPAITLADLRKDDWIGAVIGRVDVQGKAVAFNMLAGIEVFAARANRGGGVDVGMPAGLLDGAFGVP